MCVYNYTQGATSCPDYPVINYTLVLIEASTRDMEMLTLEETSDGVFLLDERYVEYNSRYSYYVLVIHDLGTVQSTPVQIGIHK